MSNRQSTNNNGNDNRHEIKYRSLFVLSILLKYFAYVLLGYCVYKYAEIRIPHFGSKTDKENDDSNTCVITTGSISFLVIVACEIVQLYCHQKIIIKFFKSKCCSKKTLIVRNQSVQNQS